MKQNRSGQIGFTLIELLVTVTIAALIMAIGVPSFSGLIKSNRLTSYANDLMSALYLARSEAIKRGVTVTVRKVDNNSATNLGPSAEWEDGWDVFTDVNADGVYNVATDKLLKTYSGLKQNYTLRGNTLFVDKVRYNSSGAIVGAGVVYSLVICDNSDGGLVPTMGSSKLVQITPNGRARIMPDINIPPDGIPNKSSVASSNILSCIPPF